VDVAVGGIKSKMQVRMSIDWRIMSHIANELATQIEKFNASQFGDDNLDDAATVPIATLADILDGDSDIND
jgi:hypothetical protein